MALMSRRTFGATAIGAIGAVGSGCASLAPTTGGSRAGATDVGLEFLRFVGAFGFRNDRKGMTAFGLHDHRPVLIVHEDSLIEYPSGVKPPPAQSGGKFARIHDLFDTPSFRYRAFCVDGLELHVVGADEETGIRATRLVNAFKVLEAANSSMDRSPKNAPSSVKVVLRGGYIDNGPYANVKDAWKTWRFKNDPSKPETVGENELLTDCIDFGRGGLSVRVETLGGALTVRPGPQPLWLVNLATQSGDGDPHILQHGKMYFNYFELPTGTKLPVATTDKFARTAKPFSLDCFRLTAQRGWQRMDAGIRSPPDTELCYCALL